jgi:hypothetical protein
VLATLAGTQQEHVDHVTATASHEAAVPSNNASEVLLKCCFDDAALCMLQGSDQADVLSWQELKLAAEAGFEELLRHQEAAAAAAAGTASMRCPGMSRAKGGGAVPTAAAAAAAAAGPGEDQQANQQQERY